MTRAQQPWWLQNSGRRARTTWRESLANALIRHRTALVDTAEVAALTGVFGMALGGLMLLGKLSSL